MSMADNPRYGSRRGDGSEQRGGPRTGNDPLEELARLIGRDDPFADLRRENPPPPRTEPAAAPPRDERPAPNWLARERGGPRLDVADQPPVAHDHQPDPQWRAGRYRDQAAPEEPAAPEHFPEPPRYADEPDDARQGYDQAAAYPEEGSYGSSYDAALPVARDYDTDGDYAEDLGADADDAYRAPLERRNGSRKTILAVVGIIVLLVGGAFGYRTLTAPRDASQTPVILADRSLSKIVPAGQSADGQSNKLIYDRVADKPPQDSGELVPREEHPVDVRGATPRVVFPGTAAGAGGTPPSPQTGGAAGQAPAAAATGSGAGEPKKVRTLTIRPDQAGVADAADSSAFPATPTTRGAASSAAPVNARAPQHQAAASPETEANAAAPRGPAASSRAPDAGGYLVQLFSGKSEAEAQDQFRALQGKYQNILGGRQPIIRRADLGDKGVFYRAQVGPFATNDLAIQFCESLKTAGGKCIVQRN